MTARFLQRLGVVCDPADARLAWGVVLGLLAVYALAFFAFFPSLATVIDEASYLRQAEVFLGGTTHAEAVNPLTGEINRLLPSNYPVGTAVLLMPFMALGGERAAFLVPFLCLAAGVLFTAGWLREERRSPLFALLVLGFPSSLLLGRVAMSDVPSLAVVSLGLWLFWRGLDRGWPWWLASGLLAGAAVTIRESNCLPFVAFYAGALLRRDRAVWALIAGGLAGIGLRLLSAWVVYDDPLFYRVSIVLFGQGSVLRTLPLHAIGLLVLVPGGLVAGLLYRGRRWPELVASVVLFTGFYLAARYDATELSPGRRLILGLRFFIPLVPILAFAMAEVLPRLWARLVETGGARRRAWLHAVLAGAVVLWLGGVAAASVGVHWIHHRWSAPQARVRELIYQHVDREDVVVSNLIATGRYLRIMDVPYIPIERYNVAPMHGAQMVRRYGGFRLVLLDRSDSPQDRIESEWNAEFVEKLRPPPTLLLDEQVTPTSRLRIFEVTAMRNGADLRRRGKLGRP